MPRRLRLPREQFPDFAALRDIGTDGLERLRSSIPPVMLRASELEAALRAYSSERSEGVSGILLQLASLVLADSSQSIGDLFDDVTAELRESAKWSSAELEVWTQETPTIKLLVAMPGLVTLAKAVRLQWDHTNVLAETHIITDLRPVFDADASRALAAIICHTLRLSYNSEGRTHHIALAVDTGDLQRLQRDVERALKKAEVMKDYLKAPTPLPARLQGVDDAT
jgi:hypothetical protein